MTTEAAPGAHAGEPSRQGLDVAVGAIQRLELGRDPVVAEPSALQGLAGVLHEGRLDGVAVAQVDGVPGVVGRDHHLVQLLTALAVANERAINPDPT